MTKRVIVESKDLKPVSKEAEIFFDGPNVHGRLSNLSHEEIALLRPCSDPSLCIIDPVTSSSYRLELLDADGKFVARPSGSATAWAELGDPLSQQSA
jgi:hypothetical protein